MMKPSISKVDDLVFKEVEVPQDAFVEYCKKFPSEELALNEIEFRIEQMLRRQRRLVLSKTTNDRKKITVGINPYLVPIMETYCALKGLPLNEFIMMIMKWTRRRKQ